MKSEEQNRAVRRITAQIVEEIGADAVVVTFSKTSRRNTSVHVHTWGNQLACCGLAEHAAEALEEAEPETEDEEC